MPHWCHLDFRRVPYVGKHLMTASSPRDVCIGKRHPASALMWCWNHVTSIYESVSYLLCIYRAVKI